MEVKINVVDARTDAEKYEAKGQDITVDKGNQPDPADGISNKEELPEDTTYDWADPIDTNVSGDITGTVIVTYPDGSKDSVTVTITVKENTTDTELYSAQGGIVNKPYGQTATEKEIISVVTTDAPPEKVQSIKVTSPIPIMGQNKTVSVTVVYTDDSTDTVVVVVNYGDASDIYNPEGQNITVNKDEAPSAEAGIANKDELPAGTQYGWKEAVDTSTPGETTGTVIVTYPDQSTDEVEVKINVVDSRTDADKYDPETQPEIIKPGEKPDLSDNVTNIDKLPEGTIVEDITPEGAIDVNKPGDYTGTLKVTYPDGSEETVNVKVIVKRSEIVDDNNKNIGNKDTINKDENKSVNLGPNTGYTGNGSLQVAGLLSSIGALLGLSFARKRKKENKH